MTRLKQVGTDRSVDEPLRLAPNPQPITPASLPTALSERALQEGESRGLLPYSKKKLNADYAKQYLRQIKTPGLHLVFIGVMNVETPFKAVCGDGQTLQGTMVSWDVSTTGVLACHRTPRVGSFSELAKKYCL